MDRLPERYMVLFGRAIKDVTNTTTDEKLLGMYFESMYLRLRQEAERDARDEANGKTSN